MTTEHKSKAIEIITASNSIKVSFNVPKTNSYSNVYEILIHDSNATVINDLVSAGYYLYMTEKGLCVTKF